MIVVMVILTIIITVALTIPGGNDQNKGAPLLVRNDLFYLFLRVVLMAFTFFLFRIVVFLIV